MVEISKYLKFRNIQITILFVLVISVYANSLTGDFLYLDDYGGFVNNSAIQSLSTAFKSFNINTVIYALSYKLFGLNPVPLHIMSLILHLSNVLLGYTFLSKYFKNEVAFFPTALFAVHPVNTEVVAWISGRQYLYVLLFLFPILLLLDKFQQSKNTKYYWFSVIFYILVVFLYRNPRVGLIPPAVVLINYGIMYKKYKPLALLKFVPYFIGGLFLCLLVYSPIKNRLAENGPNSLVGSNYVGTYLNEESYIPIVESYPYTFYSMLQYYIFPVEQTVYHDGGLINRFEYIFMFLLFIAFIQLLLYLFFKNDKRAYVLLLMLVFLAPSLSPVKLIWYFSERYLYFGGLFFFSLIVPFLFKLVEKRNLTRPLYVFLLFVLVLLSLMTIKRNTAWASDYSLALATIEVIPNSPKGYNDLGNDIYRRTGDYKEALNHYKSALKAHSDNHVALNNSGYILLNEGIPAIEYLEYISSKNPNYFELGVTSFENKSNTKAIYYLSLASTSTLEEEKLRLNIIAELLASSFKYSDALVYIEHAYTIDSSFQRTLLNLFIINFQLKNTAESQKVLDEYVALFGEDFYYYEMLSLLKE